MVISKEKNIIYEHLEKIGEKIFYINKNSKYSYNDLLTKIYEWIKLLNVYEINPGDVISIIGESSPDLIFLFMALIINNNIIVPLTEDSQQNHENYFNVSSVDGIFYFSSESEWKYSNRISGKYHNLIQELKCNKEAGLVLFSSGTTGDSKAVVHRVSSLINRFFKRKGKSLRTIIFLKLDHIGGVNTLFSIMLNGGTIVSTSDRKPDSICDAIQKNKIELLPTTPSFINMLILSENYKNYDLSSLKVITYGTEPMPISTLNAVREIFPDIKLKQTYGLTELGIFPTKSLSSGSTLMKVGGDDIEIDIRKGKLFIRSKNSMLGYLNAPDPFDENGWYNTGDMVEIEGEYIRILGRESSLINVGGEKLHPSEVENVIMQLEHVKNVIVSGKKSPITGQIVKAVVHTDFDGDKDLLRSRIIKHCADNLESYKVPRIILFTQDNLISGRYKKVGLIDNEVVNVT